MHKKKLSESFGEFWLLVKDYLKGNARFYLAFALSFLIAYSSSILLYYSSKSALIFWISLAVLLISGLSYAYQTSSSWMLADVKKLPLSYGIYLIGAYFIRMTLNLNNDKFDWQQFKHFWDLQFLAVLVPVGLVILLLRYYNNGKRRRESQLDSRYLRAQCFGMIVIAGDLIHNRFLGNTLLSVGQEVDGKFLAHLFWYDIGFFLFFSLLAYLGIRAWETLRSNQVSPALAFVTSVVLAMIFNYLIQAGITDMGAHYGMFIASGATLFQIGFLTTLFMVIYTLTNRYPIGTVINILIGSGLSLVNAIKFELRNEPLLFSDFGWLTNIGFFKEYLTADLFWVILSVLAIFIGLILAAVRYGILQDYVFKDWRLRLATFLVLFGLSFGTSTVFRTNKDGEIPPYIPVLSSVYNLYDVNWQGINANARFQSLSFVWMKQYSEKMMDEPKGYSKEKVADIYKRYKALADEINASRGQNISDQTVIYILSESFVDPTRIDGLTVSQDPLPNIHRIMGETTSGRMTSDGYGGGTANMEFQTLTGLPMSNYSDMVSILYSDVAPNMSKMPSLSDAFPSKNRVALHLADANNYSRVAIYSKLGFSKFIAAKGTKFKPQQLEQVSTYYSDKSTYQNILNNLQSDQNQFFSVMTMQNHGPWDYFGSADISAEGSGFDKEQNKTLTNYVNLLRETDSSTEEFLDQLKGIDKKISVVFYGDHLPGLFPNDYFKQQPSQQYQTDYFIWSNYETPKLDYPLVNSSDFGAELLEVTNSKVSPYYALLTQVLKQNSDDHKGVTPNSKEIAEDLKMIQYDISVGNNYIGQYKDFFAFPKT